MTRLPVSNLATSIALAICLAACGGPNAFSGIFTGPQAQELIGQWAFPFLVAGTTYSADGVWVAKRGN